MKFPVDNQLPAALAQWLRSQGEDAEHVLERGMDTTADEVIWRIAAGEGRIVISKDEDFFTLANRPGDSGSLLWVRIGNCRTAALLARFASALAGIRQSFAAGHRIVILP